MRATLKRYRQAPRKVRLVANLIKGKTVAEAKLELKHLTKRAAAPLVKLLNSALANAARLAPPPSGASELVVTEIRVDKGPVLKRLSPRARGRAAPIHKHTSRIHIILERKT